MRQPFCPFFGPFREGLVIVCDPEHHLLRCLIPHIIGKRAHLFGAFTPVRRIINEGRHKTPPKRTAIYRSVFASHASISSTISPISQSREVTPAAIAGVILSD